MKIKSLIGFCGICLLLACNTPSEKTPPTAVFDITTAKKEIEKLNLNYGDRFKQDDEAYYQERYTTDALIMPDALPAIKGMGEIRKYYYNNGENKTLTINVTTTNLYGGAEAIVEEGEFDFPDDKGGSVDKGKFIAIWKQENGKWKLFREIWNSNSPKK